MIFKCGCCKKETNDDDAEYVYQGMGVSQYVCPKCQLLPFFVVSQKLCEEDSPDYIGNRLSDEVLRGSAKVIK